jgi:hypothetical protein
MKSSPALKRCPDQHWSVVQDQEGPQITRIHNLRNQRNQRTLYPSGSDCGVFAARGRLPLIRASTPVLPMLIVPRSSFYG